MTESNICMNKKFDQTVSDIPSGIFTCFLDGEEVGILEFSPSHIKIRLSNKVEKKIENMEIICFNLKEKAYRTIKPEKVFWSEPTEKEFWWEYCGMIEDEKYREVVSFVIKQYYDYIVIKSESFDNVFSKELIGYPAEKDDEFHENLATWKLAQQREIEQKNFIEKMLDLNVEIAVSLENPECYDAFLNDNLAELIDKRILEKANRFYIGNQFCHNLFPKWEQLFQMLEKARAERKQVTLAFTYLREELLDATEQLLEEIYQWSKMSNFPLEIIINDWGMLQGKEDYFSIGYGTLLNRRRKDPRYSYKNTSEKEWECLEENSLNVEEYKNFIGELGITRLEYECSGYLMKLPGEKLAEQHRIQGITMHLPLYQTNTSQFCTLHALCTKQNRGHQEFIRECPKYCKDYACMYPKHLNMIGRYNSLFAMDKNLLEHPEILERYKNTGMDRIVWNLI